MPLREWTNVFNCCLINPWIHTLRINSWIFLFFLIWLLNIAIVVSVSFGSIFITWKRWGSFANNVMPLRERTNVLYSSLINPWIHALWVDCWVFLAWRFLNITIITSVSSSSIFITWKWWGSFTDNIMPLREWANVFNCSLINPRIHSLWIYGGVFLLFFSFMLMKATWNFIWWSVRFWNATWRSIWSWEFVIKHAISYKLPDFWSYFFISNIEIFSIILSIKSSSFWIWISTFRICSSYSGFWI